MKEKHVIETQGNRAERIHLPHNFNCNLNEKVSVQAGIQTSYAGQNNAKRANQIARCQRYIVGVRIEINGFGWAKVGQRHHEILIEIMLFYDIENHQRIACHYRRIRVRTAWIHSLA